jgi:hypothetical protein
VGIRVGDQAVVTEFDGLAARVVVLEIVALNIALVRVLDGERTGDECLAEFAPGELEAYSQP